MELGLRMLLLLLLMLLVVMVRMLPAPARLPPGTAVYVIWWARASFSYCRWVLLLVAVVLLLVWLRVGRECG